MIDRLMRALVGLLRWPPERGEELLDSARHLAAERGRFGAASEVGSLVGLVLDDRSLAYVMSYGGLALDLLVVEREQCCRSHHASSLAVGRACGRRFPCRGR